MRILYVCNDPDYWLAHRAATARTMAAHGDEVALLTGMTPTAACRTGDEDPRSGLAPLARRSRGAENAGTARLQAALGADARPAVLGNAAAHAKTSALIAAGLNGDLLPLPSADFIVPGGRLATIPLERQRLSPRGDLLLAGAVRAAVRAFRPDVVHLLTLKPILFGGAALRLRTGSSPRVVATFAGLGRVFAADPPDRRQRLVLRGLRFALGGARTVAVFENEADRARLTAARVVSQARSAVVRGAGFDPGGFPAAPMPPGPAEGAMLEVLFASRMLRAKGVDAVIDAARRLRHEAAPVRITLAGPTGDDPDAVPESDLADLHAAGVIRYLGTIPADRMGGLIADHHVLALPTRYPEGTPRILAEAGAVGRPAIVSDHPGCTTFIRDGIEGIVLAPADGPAIAAAIRRLVEAPGTLAAMGEAARARALQGGFTTAAVAAEYRRLYRGEAG